MKLFVPQLFVSKFDKAGRSRGRIATRHRGGATLKRYPLLNRRRRLFNILGRVVSVNATSLYNGRVALVFYKEFALYEYVLCPHGVRFGSFVLALRTSIAQKNYVWFRFTKYLRNLGNSLLLQHIKVGALVFNIETSPGQGGCYARAAGTSAKLVQKISIGLNKVYVALRMRSGSLIYVKGQCMATLGQCSNVAYSKKPLRKAGTSRHLGFRPRVRGVAMNPVDHPHGGGEGKTSGGRSSVSAWGRLTKGKRTIKPYAKQKYRRLVRRMRFGKALR